VQEYLTVANIVRYTKIDGLEIAPSNVLLSSAETPLAKMKRREYVLREKLESVVCCYEYCIIDCSRSKTETQITNELLIFITPKIITQPLLTPTELKQYQNTEIEAWESPDG
jgi:cellulose biosynthesis protein BcsQ